MLCIRYVFSFYPGFYFQFLKSFLLTLILLVGNDNPCEDGNFKFLIKAGQRGGNCKIQASNVVCDHFISDGWYKVLHEDDLKPRKLLDTRVDPNFCGTSNPIWLNGKEREVALQNSVFLCDIYIYIYQEIVSQLK